jgi:hypothetical protein
MMGFERGHDGHHRFRNQGTLWTTDPKTPFATAHKWTVRASRACMGARVVASSAPLVERHVSLRSPPNLAETVPTPDPDRDGRPQMSPFSRCRLQYTPLVLQRPIIRYLQQRSPKSSDVTLILRNRHPSITVVRTTMSGNSGMDRCVWLDRSGAICTMERRTPWYGPIGQRT